MNKKRLGHIQTNQKDYQIVFEDLSLKLKNLELTNKLVWVAQQACLFGCF